MAAHILTHSPQTAVSVTYDPSYYDQFTRYAAPAPQYLSHALVNNIAQSSSRMSRHDSVHANHPQFKSELDEFSEMPPTSWAPHDMSSMAPLAHTQSLDAGGSLYALHEEDPNLGFLGNPNLGVSAAVWGFPTVDTSPPAAKRHQKGPMMIGMNPIDEEIRMRHYVQQPHLYGQSV